MESLVSVGTRWHASQTGRNVPETHVAVLWLCEKQTTSVPVKDAEEQFHENQAYFVFDDEFKVFPPLQQII